MPHNAANVKHRTMSAGLSGPALIIFVLGVTVFPSTGFARFLDADRDEIDREERLNSENFNDEISYRPPIYWEHLFDSHDIAARFNGGSYNARRFMYEEDIKIVSPSEHAVTFRFLQERQHNLLGNFNDRQLQATWNSLRPAYFTVMADGDSEKKNADLGLSAGFDFSRATTASVYYWSVNHYYNSKRDRNSRNQVERPTKTWGGTYAGRLAGILDISMRSEIDTPYRFAALDDGYLYEYSQQRHFVSVSQGQKTDGHYWDVRWHRELKKESKAFDATEEADAFKKALHRKAEWLEGRYSYGVEHSYHLTGGLLYIDRNANYEWDGDASNDEITARHAEAPSPSIQRNEAGAYSTYFRRLSVEGWRSHGYQLGLFVNAVRFNEQGHIRSKNEVKLQTAWNVFITENAQMFWNATFNLDGLYSDFPYDSETFKPWDGGALNIVAAF